MPVDVSRGCADWLTRELEAAGTCLEPGAGTSGTSVVPFPVPANPLMNQAGTTGTSGTNEKSCAKGNGDQGSGLNPYFEFALARELWPDGKGRSFLIDTGTRAKTRLIDAVPDGIGPDEWRGAIERLSGLVAATGQPIRHGLDELLTITFGGEWNGYRG
jgi:hypothetical protein